MKFTAAALALLATTTLCTVARADEGTVALSGIPKLDHVFVVMMENHGYAQVIGNPDMPWFNAYAKTVNMATNYYAVAHPSETNYLEIVGGSNFGILNDNTTDYGNTSCLSTLAPGGATNESNGGADGRNCPIAGTGMDTATPKIDYSNETSGPPGDIEIDGKHEYPAASTAGKSIADQLVANNMTWKTYQESLPSTGPWGVTTADGQFADNSTYTADELAEASMGLPAENGGQLGKLYRMKHNPFMAFASVQAGYNATTGQVAGIASYEGSTGLWADLATGHVPNYSLIVPNQCHDQHGGTSGAFSYAWCAGDYNNNGTLAGLNPGTMQSGDIELHDVITAIKASPAWTKGRNAIVVVWDENDYTPAVSNQVVATVDTNYGSHGVTSSKFYTHFSLLKTIEAGFGLPCLNHACDASTALMGDLFH